MVIYLFRKNQTLDDIHDIHGLRLIVEKQEDCYAALEIVHGLWPEVDGTFKDYVAHPKVNGYIIVDFYFIPFILGFLSHIYLLQVPITAYCCSKPRVTSSRGSDSNQRDASTGRVWDCGSLEIQGR